MNSETRAIVVKLIAESIRENQADAKAYAADLNARLTAIEKLELKDGRDGRDGRNGKDGRDGIDGIDGADAFELQIIGRPDDKKNYRDGTLAAFDGGLWRYNNQKWAVIVDGIKSVSAEMDLNGQILLTTKQTSGADSCVAFDAPGFRYKGVWKAADDYAPGDCLTHDGSLWMCLKTTTEKPGEFNKDWQLCVKRGRNGKSA